MRLVHLTALGLARLSTVETTVGHTEGAEGLSRQVLHVGDGPGPAGVVELDDVLTDLQVPAPPEEDVRRALRDERESAVVLPQLERGHHLALGCEGHLTAPFEAVDAVHGAVQLACGDEERGLRRVTLDLPLAVVLGELGVVRERAAAQDEAGLVRQSRIGDDVSGLQRLALGSVADTGEVDGPRGGQDALDRHLVLRQCPGLVRGDDGGGPERLDGVEVLHHGLVAGQTLHADGQDHGQDGRQALRDRGDREGDPQQQHGDVVAECGEVVDERGRDHHDDSDDDDRDAEQLADAGDLLLERAVLLLGGLEHLGDGAHLGAHGGARDHGATDALADRRALVDHVEAVYQRGRLAQRGGVLGDGLALAGQRRLGDPQDTRLEQAPVSPDGVPLPQDQHVAAHEVDGGHGPQLAVAQHGGRGRRHGLQGGDGVLRLVLLDEPEQRVQYHDGKDDEGVDGQARGSLDDPGSRRDDDGDEQEVDQRVLELGEDLAPQRHGWRGTQLVRPVHRETASSLLRAEPNGRLDGEVTGDVGGITQGRVRIIRLR